MFRREKMLQRRRRTKRFRQPKKKQNSISQNIAVKEELQKLVKAVRGKYQEIRRNEDEKRSSLEIGSKPFVEPLQKQWLKV